MTTRSGEPAAGSLALQRIRIRKCGVKLHMPGIEFTCQLEKHTPDVSHQEEGVVTMSNGTMRTYTICWFDQGVAQLRQYKTKKVRKVTT